MRKICGTVVGIDILNKVSLNTTCLQKNVNVRLNYLRNNQCTIRMYNK